MKVICLIEIIQCSMSLVAIKVLVVGNGQVGKSSLINRFCKGTFTDQYKQTIGVDFLEKQINVKSAGESVTLMLW